MQVTFHEVNIPCLYSRSANGVFYMAYVGG